MQIILYKLLILVIIKYIDGIFSKRDELQDANISQLKLEVYDTYKKDEKITTSFEPTDESDVINKGHLDKKLKK